MAADLNYATLRVRAALKLGRDMSSRGAVSELTAGPALEQLFTLTSVTAGIASHTVK